MTSPRPNGGRTSRSASAVREGSKAAPRREVVLEAHVLLLQLGEPVGDRGVDAEVAHRDAVGQAFADAGDEGVVDVEDDPRGGLLGQLRQQLCRVVDLGEPVELVAGDVEQERMRRLHRRCEPQGVRLVELQHGQVGPQPAAEWDLAQHRGDDAPGEVAARGVAEDLEPVGAQDRDEHLRGGRLAVGAAHDDDTAGDVREGVAEEAGVDPLRHEARQSRAPTAQAGRSARRLAGHHGRRRPQHRATVVQRADGRARGPPRRRPYSLSYGNADAAH
jgi:hypothetical protein